jgi:putative membrane protein
MATNVSGLAVVPINNSSLSQQDQTFLQQAQEANLTEIAEAKVALTHSSDVATQEFALWMIGDHSALAAQLSTIATQFGVSLPTVPSADDQAVIAQLDTLTGSTFDQAYAQDEVQGHQQAVTDFQKEAGSGQNTEVIALANVGLPIIEAHNEQASILAGQGDPGLGSASTPPAIAPGRTVALSTQDQSFVQMAASMNQLEIEEGNLAIKQGDTASAEFGRWMVSDHTVAENALAAIGQRDGFSVPTSLTSSQQQELNNLTNAGSNFDLTYATDQVVGHVDTLMAFIKEAETGSDPSLVNFAETSIPVLATHLLGAADIGLDSIGLQVSVNDASRLINGLDSASTALGVNSAIASSLDSHPSVPSLLSHLG